MRNLSDIDINGTTLDLILARHGQWLAHVDGGERANLVGTNLVEANLVGTNLDEANLVGTNLREANLDENNLWGCTGNGSEIKSVFCDTYQITYTAEIVQIGCERHLLQEWWNFDDRRILVMDGKKALEWWKRWKPALQQIIETSPATPTKIQSGESETK